MPLFFKFPLYEKVAYIFQWTEWFQLSIVVIFHCLIFLTTRPEVTPITISNAATTNNVAVLDMRPLEDFFLKRICNGKSIW